MARRLKTIARWVNENLGSYGFKARVQPSEYRYTVGNYGGNVVGYHGSRDGTLFQCWKKTDMKDLPTPNRANRYLRRRLHKDRNGVIWERIKSHNSAETYRYNGEVENFVRYLVAKVREENPDADVANYEAEEFGADFMPNEMGEAPDGWNKYEPSNDEDDYTDRMWKFIDDNLGYNYFISSDDEDEVRRFRKDLYDWMGETSNYVRTAYNAEEFGAERYEPTPKEIRFLVRNLRAVWIKYERGIYDEDDVIQKMERILYHTGVMQEEYEAEEFEAEVEEDWRERFFKNPQVLTRNGKDIALVDDRTRSGNFGGITIIHPIEGGDSQDGWYGDTTQIVYSNGKLDYIEMPGGERAYADEMKTHYAEEFGAEEFEARENKDGTVVLSDAEWNRCKLLHNGNYLWYNDELKHIGGIKSGNKFEKVRSYYGEALGLVHKYEKALKEQRRRLMGWHRKQLQEYGIRRGRNRVNDKTVYYRSEGFEANYDWGNNLDYFDTIYDAEEFGAEYDWRGWDESGRNTVKKYQRFGWDIVKTEYWKHPEDSTKESYYEVRKIMEDGTQIDEEITYTKNVFGEGYMWRGYQFGNLKSVLSFIDEKTEMLRKEHGAESFQSETQATVISSLVSLGALGVGILLGKKLFFDEKVLG